MNPEIADRLRGIAVGAAVGDALGMPLEFRIASPPDNFIRTMQTGRLPAGSFTDDTEMALALAESLLVDPALDPHDLSQRFLDWYRRNPPDVGIHTNAVMRRLAAGMSWQEAARDVQSKNPTSSGNGSVMRCWPVAVFNWDDLDTVVAQSQLQSRVTHPHEECLAGCTFVNSMIFHLLHGLSVGDAYQRCLNTVDLPPELRQTILLAPRRKREELRNTGWVRHTIESALWGVMNTHSFEEALVQVINLGEDADTAGTVAGAIAGAMYGLESIPPAWKNMLRGEWPIASGKMLYLPDFIRLADDLAGGSNQAARSLFLEDNVI